MSRLKIILTLAAAAMFLFLSGTLSAADLTGKWSGSFVAKTPDGETNDGTAWMSLVQKGDKVTGTAGPTAEQQTPITNAKLEGDQLEFKVQVDDALVTVRLKLDGDRLQGQAVIDAGDGKATASLDLKRVP